jgi:hypothetical protein
LSVVKRTLSLGMKLFDDIQLVFCEARRFQEDRGVRVPFEPGLVDEGRPANGDLADVVWQRVFGSDGSQECVPAWAWC